MKETKFFHVSVKQNMSKTRKKFILAIAVFLILMLSACMEKDDTSEECAVWKMGSTGYLTEDGYYFTVEDSNHLGQILYYFDIETGNTVPVCDKAECAHRTVDLSTEKSASCNAQINTDEIVVYMDKIYYFSGEDMKISLRRRDIDGNNDEKVADINAPYQGGRMWIYQNRAFVMASTSVSQSFDPETHTSDESVLKFFVINLNNGEVDELSESTMASAVNYAFQVYKMKDGKVYFYDLAENKCYVYDIASEALEEADQKSFIINGTFGEYLDIYGNYCYDCFEDDSEQMNIMRLDTETGEESVIYTGESKNLVEYVIWGLNNMYIIELNQEENQIKNICFYDMDSGELNQASGDFYTDYRMCMPCMGTDQGFVYWYAVNKSKEEQSYGGDFEYRYMSLADMIAGNDRYQSIYYLEQEDD
jgi:hypothetical protein